MRLDFAVHPVFLRRLLLSTSTLVALSFYCTGQEKERSHIAVEIENSIQNELLNKWYPQCIDEEYGGFISTFSYDFKPVGPQLKMIVTQARHTWVNAKASQQYPAKTYYRKGAEQGFHFLKNSMWDKTYGGFYSFVDRQGNVQDRERGKNAYGNAFGIFALAAYFNATGDTAALILAQKTFRWLENHSHDPIHRGYYQQLERDGTPILKKGATISQADTGYKDQNSSIHLLEAFTELFLVWPDSLLRTRLQEMLFLIRDKITTPKGYLTLYFEPDWTPVSYRDSSEAYIKDHRYLDHVSFGHDVETAYLMLEASHALNLKDDTITLKISKRMVDHALLNGWDNRVGGFYDEGYYFKASERIAIIKDTKNWWAQAEGLNALLLMADYFPNDKMKYFEDFKILWKYINTYLIDHEYGDWYEGGIDKEPQKKTALKGHIWKATYHHFRSMSNCVQRLTKKNELK